MNATACYFMGAMADENIEIARGLRRRDTDVLDCLIEKYQHRLLRYLLYLTLSRDLAEDIFQETWLRVLERGSQYDGDHEFSTWLFAIARNLFIDYLRREQPASLDGLANSKDTAPFDPPATNSPSALDLVLQHEQNEQISAGMQHLPPKHREALVLRFQEEMRLEEIAGLIGVPVGTVKSRIYRGLTALQPWLKGGSL